MFTFHPTIRLAGKMKVEFAEPSGKPAMTKLGNWYAQEMLLTSKHYIVCMSEYANLTVVLEGSPYKTCPQRLCKGLQEVLLDIGLPEANVDRECAHMGEFQIAKSIDRMASGQLNLRRIELESAYHYTGKHQLTALELSRLANNKISTKLPEGYPHVAARNLLI